MIAITGGGTGGHLAIARTFNAQLNERGIKTMFIGSTSGLDKMWFENDENFSQKHFLTSSGVVNKSGLNKIKSLLNIINLSFKTAKILKQNNVKAVISVGGYSAAAASFGALWARVPLFIHEQNAINGKLNSILKPFCKGFFSSYQNPPFAYPVGARFFKARRVRDELKTIIFLGGSQGAAAINDLAVNLAPKLDKMGIKIIHQCGKEADKIKKRYENLAINADVFDFDKAIELKMQTADLAICRAGASSLWEITANALPAIFVPYPFAAKNHQFFNAKFLADKSLAKISLQNGEKANVDEILKMIENYDINGVSNALLNEIDEQKTAQIIDEILRG